MYSFDFTLFNTSGYSKLKTEILSIEGDIFMKRLISLILIGTMALSLAACGNANPNKDTTEESQVETKPTEQSQPEYFKKFEATGETVKSDNKIRELMPIREYEDMWKKFTYTVFTFSQEGINGKVPSEENNYVLSLKYEELLGVSMKDIYVIMPESCEGVKDFSMLAFISGSEDSTQLFDDFVKEPRDMTMDQSVLNSFGIHFTDTTEALIQNFARHRN